VRFCAACFKLSAVAAPCGRHQELVPQRWRWCLFKFVIGNVLRGYRLDIHGDHDGEAVVEFPSVLVKHKSRLAGQCVLNKPKFAALIVNIGSVVRGSGPQSGLLI
jgi:hypothetical protein